MRENGFNAGADVEKYQRFGGGKKGDAWCAWFVTWCFAKAGIPAPKYGRARDWFPARRTIWQAGRGQTPRTGDLVGYKWGAAHVSHVGFVDVWGSGPSCQTVEGNTGGGRALLREGDGVFKNWRLKRTVAYVANWID